jgi:hypothetical protein
MTQEQFLATLNDYETRRLRATGVHIPGEGPSFEFMLVFENRILAALMLNGRVLGEARWRNGNIVLDPPPPMGATPLGTDQDFDMWVSLAYARLITALRR